MSSRAETEIVSAPPVFFLNEEAPDDVTHVDVCQAAEKLVGFGSIVGAQRLGSLWRLYPTTREIRAKLLTLKLLIRSRSIQLRSQNPFAVRDSNGTEIPSTRLTIDGLPISVANADLEGYLLKAGASFRSTLNWEKARDGQGKLTRWVTGRRFVWIDLPATPLPNKIQIGTFVARLYYREQPRQPMLCFTCGKEGHRKGDMQCPGPQPVLNETEPRVVEEEISEDSSETEEAEKEESQESTEDESDDADKTLEEDKSAGVEVGKEGKKGKKKRVRGTQRQKKDKKKVQEKDKENRESVSGSKDKSTQNMESSEGDERGRSLQTKLESHFRHAGRASSLKRADPPSPTDGPPESQRPRH